MAMKQPLKSSKPRTRRSSSDGVDVGLGFSSTPKKMDKAVYNYFKQKGYSEQSAAYSKGKSPSAGTRSTPKPDPVFHKTDKLRSKLTGQKSRPISPQVRDSGKFAGYKKANAANVAGKTRAAAKKNAKNRY